MSENFIIKNSFDKGKGVFSTVDFEKNQIIFKFKGINLSRDIIPDFSGEAASCHLQIGKDLYLDIRGDLSYFVNHSCNPNVAIKIAVNTAFAMAIIPIKAGQELCYDYSTTSTENKDTWSMNCKCSAFGCRKLITGFQSIPADIQKEYIKNGIVPQYVKEYVK